MTTRTADRPDLSRLPEEAPRIRGCTCLRARRLARRITQVYDHALAPCGLRVTQFSLLTCLRRGGSMAMGSLAAALDMDRTTLTRNLKPLLEMGLVSLERSPVDARQREVRLTDEGRARRDEAKRLWRRAQDHVNRIVGEPRVASLHDLFDGLLDTLNHAEAGGSPVKDAGARP